MDKRIIKTRVRVKKKVKQKNEMEENYHFLILGMISFNYNIVLII